MNYFSSRGLHSTEVAFLLLTRRHWVPFLAFPKIYFDVADIYRQRRLVENNDGTHLVLLASGKLVLQKNVSSRK